MKRLLPLLLALVTTSARGQIVTRVLIPIAIGPSPGAFGSLWVSELWARNETTSARSFDADEFCAALCQPKLLMPAESRQVPFYPQPASEPAVIAYVEGGPGDVTFNLRVRDLSRQAETWGTEVPVVHEGSFLSGDRSLLNIPIDARFRQTLRIFNLDGVAAPFRLRAFVMSTNETLGTVDVVLRSPTPGPQLHYKPSYAQLGDLVPLFPRAAGLQTIGLQLIPLTPDVRYWAFVSITNNDTQHVTTITPQ